MAKGNSAKEKQNQIMSQFKKDIRQDSQRDWLTSTERAIQQGKKRLKTPSTETVRISTYNPNNPLNGSSTWNREKREQYRASLKK